MKAPEFLTLLGKILYVIPGSFTDIIVADILMQQLVVATL